LQHWQDQCSIPLTRKDVYQLTCTQKKAPDENEVQMSLQNYGPLSVEFFFVSPVRHPEFGEGIYVFGKPVDP